jgi:5-methylcytosine-specific restriction endonuclease McrA
MRTREERLAWQRHYDATHPRKRERRKWSREYGHKVRARRRGVDIGVVDFDAVVASSDGVCGICQQPIRSGESVEFDHIVPFALGGQHVELNLQLAHAHCNRKKGNRIAA